MRKSAVLLLSLVTAAAFTLAGCGISDPAGEVAAIREVAVTPASVTLAPGGTADLSVEIVTEGDVGEVDVRWDSDRETVATVEPTGDGGSARVTARSGGTATVTATVTTENAGVVDDEAEVTVTGG